MKTLLAKLLRRLGLLSFDVRIRRQDRVPTSGEIKSDELVLVESDGVQKWACLNCPGGCGQVISLSLNKTRRPRWAVIWDFWKRPSISPSVHQQNACGCHFWIRTGRIEWCPKGRPRDS